jgi:glycosyltransferase involved in cell wall biosynthesis
MCDLVKPDVVVLQNDFWHIPKYVNKLRAFKEFSKVPLVGYIAVDGKNVDGRTLNGLDRVVFWTKFAEVEAKEGGLIKPSDVVPLGVDASFYTTGDRDEARVRLGIPREFVDKMFIVGNVNRNQIRKRMDLTVRYFAEWVRGHKISDAYLFLHVAPTGDDGYDVEGLARYYGVWERMLLRVPQVFYGEPETVMRDTYRSMDLMLTTTQGEGFGLTTFEAMACGVPVVAPDWSALGELLKNSAWLVPCTSTSVSTVGGAVIGGVPDEELTIQGLNTLYNDRELLREHSLKGLKVVRRPEYDWKNVGLAFKTEVDKVLVSEEVAV